MKWTITASLLVTLVMGLTVVSCHETDVAPTGRMRITFDNVAGSSDLTLGTGAYQNAVGESFTVTKFNYFISNIRLRKDDGREFVVPQDSSYFLIEEEKTASQTINLSNIPTGNYTGITFVVGVDSARSMADISRRTGVLDPALNNGMYWDWNSGYIFMKLEGTSAVAPAAQNNAFFYHIGGFGRANVKINNIRTVTLPFAGTMARVESGSTPTIGLKTDALKLFNGPAKLSIAQNPSVMFDLYSTNLADNYAQMFSFDQIQTNQ